MKLLKQVQRQEGEEVVLGCVDGVALERELSVVGMQYLLPRYRSPHRPCPRHLAPHLSHPADSPEALAT